jgi:hypothetical protein
MREDVREQHYTEEEARQRAKEIDNVFFPEKAAIKIPVLPTFLNQEQLACCEVVLLAKCPTEQWGRSPELILQMFEFCRRKGFFPEKS